MPYSRSTYPPPGDVAASRLGRFLDEPYWVLATAQAKLPSQPNRPDATLSGFAFTPGGDRLVGWGDNGLVVWDTRNVEVFGTRTGQGGFSADNLDFEIGDDDLGAYRFARITRTVVVPLSAPPENPGGAVGKLRSILAIVWAGEPQDGTMASRIALTGLSQGLVDGAMRALGDWTLEPGDELLDALGTGGSHA